MEPCRLSSVGGPIHLQRTVTVQLLDVLHSKLGVFELQYFLSNGRFSKVAKCKGVETKDLLAVKIYKRYDTGSPALLNKELAMLKKIRGLDQDHIVQFLDEFEHKGHTCLAFEMLDRNLHELLREKRGNRLSLAEIRPIAQQVLTALESLKTAGVIHANIKPHNIMLMKHDHLRVKLIGFSAAIAAAEVKRGDAMQPFAYRSPDFILGLPVTEAVDVWSLGRVMVTMYLGSLPFPQQSPYYQMKAIVETLGQPRDELLSGGANTHLYFSPNQDSTTPAWRLKTAEEFKAVTGFPPQKHRGSSTKFNSLIDLFMLNPEENFERTRRFVSLLHRMLSMNPQERVTPSDALRHPFITLTEPHGEEAVASAAAESITSDVRDIPAVGCNSVGGAVSAQDFSVMIQAGYEASETAGSADDTASAHETFNGSVRAESIDAGPMEQLSAPAGRDSDDGASFEATVDDDEAAITPASTEASPAPVVADLSDTDSADKGTVKADLFDTASADKGTVKADLSDTVSAEEVYIPSDSADAHVGSDGVSAIGSRNRRKKKTNIIRRMQIYNTCPQES